MTAAIFGPVASARTAAPAWSAGSSYRPGDLVSYVGICYACLRAHLAQAGQEPPAAPALWRVFSGGETEVPATPTGLAAVPDGPTRIVVSWNQADRAERYELQADGSILSATSPFLHRNLAPGSSHSYRVRALNAAGLSPWSEAVVCASEKAPAPSR